MSGLATLRAARPLRIPALQTFHALGAVKRRHQGAADTSPPERMRIEARLACDMDAVIATCRDEVRELVGMGSRRSSMHVVPCGVDTGLFRPYGFRAHRTEGMARVVTVGRLVPRKGVDDIIRALALVPGCELVVAGGPPQPLLESDEEVTRLRSVATAAGVDDRVVFTGAIARPAVAALMRSADLVVCAPWYEPFGIVPVEAMACGTPVIGTAVGGLLDTVEHGATGLLVTPRRPALLAEAMMALLGDDQLRARFGRNGVRRARDLFDWRRVAEQTLAVYQRQTARRRQATRAQSA
jgi:glycosyltransferase involved in cell wall biosynthesis